MPYFAIQMKDYSIKKHFKLLPFFEMTSVLVKMVVFAQHCMLMHCKMLLVDSIVFIREYENYGKHI